MSLVFSDTSTYKGIVQMYEKEIGAERGFVSGDSDKLKEFTADVNITLDEFFICAFRSDGTWQFDDSNHTGYPIITTDLVSGQRDYPFTTDSSGNIILEVQRVMVADSSGTFSELIPVDVQTQDNMNGFYDGKNTTGKPLRYDKNANSIFLDPIPSYNSTGGLKVYVNREGSYFVYTDTIKKAGIPGIFHEYLAIKPALKYAGRNSLSNYSDLLRRVISYEGDESMGTTGLIKEYFSKRSRDERARFTVRNESCR